MSDLDALKDKWIETRDRLVLKGLFDDSGASLSIRCPSGGLMWIGHRADSTPTLKLQRDTALDGMQALHGAVYGLRPDVGAIAWGGGFFSSYLADYGGRLPQIFDEQARHIGPMALPIDGHSGLESALAGGGNALLVDELCLCLGTTCTRLALNLELFEKCAKAYVLAIAAGGEIKNLPWLVRRIANSRLAKDQRHAAQAFAREELPVESRAY